MGLCYGALSDSFSRRKVVLGGLIAFVFGSVGSDNDSDDSTFSGTINGLDKV
jgi:MFS family permease